MSKLMMKKRNKIRIKIYSVILFVMFLNYENIAQENTRYFKVCSKEGLQMDISLLKEAMETFHPTLYKYTDKARMDSIFNNIQYSLKDSLSQSEFQFLVAKGLASAHCLHTRLALNPELFNDINSFGFYLPIKRIKVENEKIYIVESTDSLLKLGDEIIAINNISNGEMLRKFYSCLSSDGYNNTFKTFAINQFFFFIYYSYINASDSYEVKLRCNNELKSITVKGLKPEDFWNKYYSTYKVDVSPVLFKMIDSNSIGYIKLNSFRPDDYLEKKIDYKNRFNEIFKSLQKNKTSDLVVDLRGCQGGSIFIPMEFMTFLIQKPFSYIGETHLKQDIPEKFASLIKKGSLYNFPNKKKMDGSVYKMVSNDVYKPKKNRFKGNIYFIVDGGTLSASGMLMAIIENQKVGKIIGEETAGSISTGAKGVEIKLPNSGVFVEISYRMGSVILENESDNGRGVFPQYPITTTRADLMNGHDAELELVKKFIKNAP